MSSFLWQYSISYLSTGLILLLLTAFVYIKSTTTPLNRSFAVYSFCIAWWALFSVLMINAPSEFWGTFWDRLCLVGVVFIPSTFIHFNFIYLKIDLRYKKFIAANYFISLFFFLANLTPFFIKGTSPKAGLNYYTDPNVLYAIFIGYFFFASILGIIIFFLSLIKSTGARKKQISLLFWSTLLGFSLGGFNYNISFQIGSPYLALLGNLGITLYGIIVAYAIVKTRLMDISVIISRTAAWVLTVVVLGSLYLGLVWLNFNYLSAAITPFFLAWSIIYGILVGEFFQRLRLFLQTTSDKLFLRGKYDYYEALAGVSSQITKTLSMENIKTTLNHTFTDIIEVADPRIYLPEDFERAGVKELTGLTELAFQDDELVIPCRLEDRLIALIVLGNKLSEDDYTDEDLGLLKALASQTAVAIDHTRSYEGIKKELEEHQDKLLETERTLARSERIASMANLIREYNHEIKTPLTIVRSEIELLPEGELSAFKKKMLKSIDRADDIVESTLRLSQPKPHKDVPLNLNKAIETALELFPPSGVHLVKELGDLPEIKGDEDDLKLVFVNLIKNATEAMPQGGELKLKTSRQEIDGKMRTVVEISDTGVGIPKENLNKIFEPFFSTHVTKGRGLGLSIVFRILREHNATIDVASQAGKGSTFRLVF